MVSRIVSRILHVIYPVLVLGIALTAWSSSSLSDVRLTPPPMGDGFNFFWNPILSTQNLNRSCSSSDGVRSVEQLTHNPEQTLNKTN